MTQVWNVLFSTDNFCYSICTALLCAVLSSNFTLYSPVTKADIPFPIHNTCWAFENVYTKKLNTLFSGDTLELFSVFSK